MENIIAELSGLTETYSRVLMASPEAVFSAKPAPGKWSNKEIIGHLVDSAQNNLQRFVRGQYETNPKIVYAQDDWVGLQQYQAYNREDLLQLWVGLNRHLCHVLRHMPAAHYTRTCDTGKQAEELRDLKWLAADYVVHMKHHLSNLGK